MKKQNKKVRMKSSVPNDKKSLKSFHKTRTILILFFILNMEAKGREKIAASHSRNKKFLFFYFICHIVYVRQETDFKSGRKTALHTISQRVYSQS